MYSISIKSTQETDMWMKKYPDEFKKALLDGVKKSILYAEGEAKKSFGKPGKLKVQTGHLRRSIKSSLITRYNLLVASLHSDVVYAAIHENGGTIRAVNSPYLKFNIDGRWVSVKEVTIPARPYLEPAIIDNLDKMSELISDCIDIRMR